MMPLRTTIARKLFDSGLIIALNNQMQLLKKQQNILAFSL
jgi:hypothetical protein